MAGTSEDLGILGSQNGELQLQLLQPSETSSPTADRIELNEVHTDADVVELPIHNLDKVEDAWGFCLIAYFPTRITGNAVGFKLCDSSTVTCSYLVHSSGWIIFKFDNGEDRDDVLNAGPFFVSGKPLLLKIMPKFFKFDDHEIKRVPVWIMLPCLPLECWNAICLSRIVSKVGKPLYTDTKTCTKENVDFARVLVEVDASKELVRNVKIRLPNGEYKQRVVFEYEPKFCTNCKMFEDNVSNCLQLKESIPTTLGSDSIQQRIKEEDGELGPNVKQIDLSTSQLMNAAKEKNREEHITATNVATGTITTSRMDEQFQQTQQSTRQKAAEKNITSSKAVNSTQNEPFTFLEHDEQLDQAADVESKVQAKGKMVNPQGPSKQKRWRVVQALSTSPRS
ncbi:uncharacterized protein LOC121996961 [Zingiber officinale]|uniref:uncharacterized protein LOC121996961 n=1 Tax=Zingiber officinale TaxID=94328 RepID=UPI001C4BF611|nr:uncharacterized protein LOC121996961 [Zingiber officinale]